MLKKFLWVFCSTVLFITGCSNVPSTESHNKIKDHEQLFDHNQENLRDLESWQFDGRFSLKVPQQSTQSAHISWLQDDSRYLIKISGPLQQGAIFLKGDDGIIYYKDSKGVTDTAASPEALLKRHTSYDLPISSLRYWVVGQYDPHYAYKLNISPKGDLRTLSQQGWMIYYDAFSKEEIYHFPTKLRLFSANTGIELMISIYDWNPDLIEGY